MRILFVGGGSIGHVAPCIAVWRAVQAKDNAAQGHFICSERIEDADFLRKEKVDFTQIRGWKFSPLAFFPSFLRARKTLRGFQPDVVLSKGGALSVPVALAAHSLQIPIVLHESDSVSGRANTLVAKWARVVCTGFPEAVTSGHSVFTGNPIRPEVTTGSKAEGLRLTGLSGKKPVLMVLGGSQGAVSLNEAVRAHIDAILPMYDLIHLTGRGKEGSGERAGYWSAPFAQEELPHLYAATDIALSRAGAGSIGELAACGIPTLLVPLEGLAQDHQLRNAEAAQAVARGGCLLLRQKSLDQTLLLSLQAWMDEAPRREAGKRMHTLFVPDAAAKIADVLLQTGAR